MVDRVDDAARDRDRVAVAVAVEDADGHDPRAVGEPGEAEAVVGLLGDRGRDVRSVPVLVERVRVVVDEVPAGHELGGGEIGRPPERLPVRVRNARVEHGDRHSRTAGRARGDQVRPGARRIDAVAAGKVPLQRLPVSGLTGGGVVGQEGLRRRARSG